MPWKYQRGKRYWRAFHPTPFLFQEQFAQVNGAPFPDPFIAQPGPGSWRVVDSDLRMTTNGHHLGYAAAPGSPQRDPARAGTAARAAPTASSLAAAWVAGQLSSDQSIACDTRMCAALAADGVASGRLVPLAAAATAPEANVVVTSRADAAQISRDAPVLLASFGTGPSQVEVRATVPGGAAAYAKALQADLAARRSGGAQLLHSQIIHVSTQAAAQLQAGQVDSRLLIMLAMLASQHQWQVVAFGGASPGVPLADAPLRQMVITGPDAKAVAAALAMVRAQVAPYAPAQAATVRLASGQSALRIDFAAPGVLGLLGGTTS